MLQKLKPCFWIKKLILKRMLENWTLVPVWPTWLLLESLVILKVDTLKIKGLILSTNLETMVAQSYNQRYSDGFHQNSRNGSH